MCNLTRDNSEKSAFPRVCSCDARATKYGGASCSRGGGRNATGLPGNLCFGHNPRVSVVACDIRILRPLGAPGRCYSRHEGSVTRGGAIEGYSRLTAPRRSAARGTRGGIPCALPAKGASARRLRQGNHNPRKVPTESRPSKKATLRNIRRGNTCRRHAKIPAMPTVVAIVNQKGGVGKSTTAINLAAYLAELGERVLVVDMDPQGNATSGLGVSASSNGCIYDVLLEGKALDQIAVETEIEGLEVAPATINLVGAEVELVSALAREFKLKRALEKLLPEAYDRVVVDCPPSLDLLTLNALTAADEVLIPIQCEYYALEGLT